MAVVSSTPSADTLFELRNATLALIALVLHTGDLDLLARALDERFGATPLFDQDPVVVDLSALAADDAALDVARLAQMLRDHRMLPIGVEGGSAAQMEAALAAGLGESSTFAATARPESNPKPEKRVAAPPPAAAQAAGAAPTVVVDRPLRSGQQVYARHADLVVLAAVNFGAEVIADGHIHVYAPLRGRAIAGARGNASARIFSTCMEPQLVAIAGTYRTTETALPAEVLGRPAQVRLDGEALVVEPLEG